MSKQRPPAVQFFREGTEIVIQSRLVLNELTPTKNRKTLITIAGEQFYVADRRASADRRYLLYKLRPWVSGSEIPGRRLLYDSAQDLVTEAESRLKEANNGTVRFVYALIFPVIGFLPLSWKELLEQRFGCSIYRHTFASICTEIGIAVAAGTLFTVFNVAASMLAVMYGAEMAETARRVVPNLMLAIIAICSVDAVFRFHHYMEDRYLGFYEWLFRRSKR